MNNHELALKSAQDHRERLESKADFVVDISMRNWSPTVPQLEKFCRDTYSGMVARFREMERNGHHAYFVNVLSGVNSGNGKNLAYSDSTGVVLEPIATHSAGWGLNNILESYKKNQEPFDLVLLSAARRKDN